MAMLSPKFSAKPSNGNPFGGFLLLAVHTELQISPQHLPALKFLSKKTTYFRIF